MRATWVVLLLLLAGCSGAATPEPEPRPARSSSPPVPPPAAAAVRPDRRSPETIAQDPRSRLLDERVTRTARGLEVEAWWGCLADGCRRDRVITRVAPDGTTSYEPWSQRRWLAGTQPDRPSAPRSMAGLLVNTAPSLAPGIRALVGGGDGATLFPFEKVARSTDGGTTWTTYDVARVDGQLGYLSGQVVLPDGRLLVLLDHWSGDRPHRPSDVDHGLWVSEGSDWGTLSPVGRLVQGRVVALRASTSGGGVLWLRTADDRVLASVDGGEAFVALSAR